MALSTWSFPVENGHLAGLDNGSSGPDVLLVHGFGYCAMTWIRLIEALEDQMHVVAVDLRGHAHSDAPPVEAGQAWRDLVRVIEERGLEKPVLVGQNSSAFLVLALAAAEPDLVSAVVTVDGDMPVATRDEVQGELELAQDPEMQQYLQERFLIGVPLRNETEVEALIAEMSLRAAEDTVLGEVGQDFEAEVRHSVVEQPDGTWRNTPDVASVAAGYQFDCDGRYYPNWDLYREITVPLTVVRCTEGVNPWSEEDAARVAERFPDLTRLDLVAGTLAQYSHSRELAKIIGRACHN